MQDNRLIRTGPSEMALRTSAPFPVRVFANSQVAMEPSGVDELTSFLDCHVTLERLRRETEAFRGIQWRIEQAAVMPDFHKGAGVPIGTALRTRGVVFPQAVGNDIGCGMRLHATDVEAASVAPRLDQLENRARRLFFEGGRQIPLSGDGREALLTGGLSGLHSLAPLEAGHWEVVARQGWLRQPDRVESGGSLPARLAPALADWVGRSTAQTYDDQIGSIGGGNHFVEFQRVERIFDSRTAYAWGLKAGALAILVHSGSVGIGHIAGRSIRELVKARYPAPVAHPENGVYPLGAEESGGSGFWDLLHNAANFACANRMMLAACAVDALEDECGLVQAPLVYDAAHNLVWHDGAGCYLHRKGATPARGPGDLEGTPFHYWGEPVLVPGSMGASSFVLAGLGKPESLRSASHGAGRSLSRGEAMRSGAEEFDRFLAASRVVTPLDLKTSRRADVRRRKIEELRAEGPHAYKDIQVVIDTLATAGIARPVAELRPVMTVKA